MAYVISDEGAYRLGLVLLFGNGLYLPIYLQKSHVFSDEGLYKLGLVLLFRYGLCLSTSYLETPRKLLYNYFWWRRLQIMVSVTVQVWFMPINKSLFISDEGSNKLGLVLPFRYGLCYFWWRRLQIRVSVTVREWLIPTNIPSETHVISYESAYKLGKKKKRGGVISDGGIYKLGLVIQSRCGLCLWIYFHTVQASFISIDIPHTVQASFITHK